MIQGLPIFYVFYFPYLVIVDVIDIFYSGLKSVCAPESEA